MLRAKAQAAGNLKSGLTDHGRATIAASHRDSIRESAGGVRPRCTTLRWFTASLCDARIQHCGSGDDRAVAFGVGIAVGAMMSSSCCGWGYSSWNCGWHGTTTVVYHGGAYYGNTAWHGGYYGRQRTTHSHRHDMAWRTCTSSAGYNPSTGTYARGAITSTAYGKQAPAKHTTRIPEPMPPPSGLQRLRELRSSTVSKNGNTAYYASTKRHPMERQVGANFERAARPVAHRESTTALPWVKPQMATSMRRRTGTPTRTPGVVGRQRERTPKYDSSSYSGQNARRTSSAPTAGEGRKEWRIIGLQQWRRRLAIQRGKRSWLGKPWRRWRLGRRGGRR